MKKTRVKCGKCGAKIYKIWEDETDLKVECSKCSNLILGFKKSEVAQ